MSWRELLEKGVWGSLIRKSLAVGRELSNKGAEGLKGGVPGTGLLAPVSDLGP